MAARVFSQQLDRSKPLWELWLVQGLTRKRFALDHQDPPRAGRRRRRASTSPPSCSTSSRCPSRPSPSTTGCPSPSPRRRDLASRKGVEGDRHAPRCASPRRLEQRRRASRSRPSSRSTEAAEALGEVGWNFANPAPEVPLNVEIGSHRRFDWVRADLRDFKGSRTPSAAPSTTSCSRWSAARCATGCAAAASAPRASSCARWCRSRSAPRTSTASSATGSRRCAARCRSTSRTRCGGCEACSQAMEGVKQLQAGARRRGDLALQRLRAADAARAGLADQLLDPPLQPDRHQRPRAPDPALRARARARGHLPGRLPAARTTRSRRDHELQRRRSTSACSPTTTRWTTSARLAERDRGARSPSCTRPPTQASRSGPARGRGGSAATGEPPRPRLAAQGGRR